MAMRIAVAVSGGVDSLVAARLLQRDGHTVFAIHFLTGFESAAPNGGDNGPLPGDTARTAAIRRMTERLGIPLTVIDLSAVFRDTVAAYLMDTYTSGRTPNPCMVCNPVIKLGHLWRVARENGAAALATGHYAVIGNNPGGGAGLFRGADRNKDQSYFLARATPEQLERTLFPLGRMQKTEVKTLATAEGLRPAVLAESQDICFIQNSTIGDFMARHGAMTPKPGPIRDLSGRQVGTHPGLHHFTIGQRRGIDVPAATPYYVVRIDAASNCLIVGAKNDLAASGCRLEAVNWIGPPPEKPFTATLKVRYRSPEVPATVIPTGPDAVQVRFDAPVAALTPGQAGVIYDDARVMGGGWIAAPMPL